MKQAVPVYINLNKLTVPDGAVNPQMIRDYVIASFSIQPISENDALVEKEFALGLRDGLWLFLFDSFDEIPAVMASADYDDTVTDYAAAIHGFLEGSVNGCSAVIASRKFRAPPGYGWPTFSIKPLSRPRQRRLIRNAVPPSARKRIADALRSADSGMANLADNPMFLGLLCDFVCDRDAFPQSPRDVFDHHVAAELSRRRVYIERRGINPDELRACAEELAYVMTRSSAGLAVPRDALETRRRQMGFPDEPQLADMLDTLEYLGLAKYDSRAVVIGDRDATRLFEFRHRRVQEYFAASLILRDRDRMDVDELLLNAPWREIAVTLCQAHPDYAAPLVRRASELLTGAAEAQLSGAVGPEAMDEPLLRSDFEWPHKARHVLALLQDAFPRDSGALPPELRDAAGRLLLSAFGTGRINHQWWALEVAGPVAPNQLMALLRAGFASGSSWLRDSAYQQVGRLPGLPGDIATALRRTLLAAAATGSLRRERKTYNAQLHRLVNPAEPLRAAREITTAQRINALGHAGVAALAVAAQYDSPIVLLLDLALVAGSYGAFFDLAAALGRRQRTAPSRPAQRDLRAFINDLKRVGWAMAEALNDARRRRFRPPPAGVGMPAKSAPVKMRVLVRAAARGLLVISLFAGFVVELANEAWLWALVAGVSLAGCAWPLTALLAVERGEHLGGLRQTLAPLSVVREVWEEIRAQSIWPVAFAALLVGLAFLCLQLLAQITVTTRTATWIYGIILGFGVLSLTVALVVTVVRRQLHDIVVFRRWQRDRSSKLTRDGFPRILAEQAHLLPRVARDDETRRKHRHRCGRRPDLVMDLEDLAHFRRRHRRRVRRADRELSVCLHSGVAQRGKARSSSTRFVGLGGSSWISCRLLHEVSDSPGACHQLLLSTRYRGIENGRPRVTRPRRSRRRSSRAMWCDRADRLALITLLRGLPGERSIWRILGPQALHHRR